MRNVPKAEGPASQGLAALRAEFPGWTIGAGPDGVRAHRETGHGGPLELGAGTAAGLRRLLDEADRIDSRHYVIALRNALQDLGVNAEVYVTTVMAKTSGGGLRAVTAKRGVYSWGSGVELCPVGDPQDAARRMLPGLGFAGAAMNAGLVTPPEAPARLGALRQHLAVHDYELELDDTGLTVIAPPGHHGMRLAVKVVCTLRLDDGGRLWFWTAEGEPIAEADHVIDTTVWIRKHLTRIGS